MQVDSRASPSFPRPAATFHSSSNPDRIFYPKRFRIGNSIRQGFFKKTPSDRIFYPKRFRIENSIRQGFWQTLSDRISYPKLFWIENCIRQIFPPRKLINHYKQTVYQSVTKISNRNFVFCIFLDNGKREGGRGVWIPPKMMTSFM